MSVSPPPDPLLDELPSRYVVGVDLGTTNSAVAYVDTHAAPWRVATFAVPQVTAPGQVEARDSLPSFHYEPATGEFPADSLRLPWQREEPRCAVGWFAREQAVMAPGRLIASAKSWLCHSGVDRTAKLLPWRGADDVERLSPVEVSARYLRHIRAAWDHAHRDQPLAGQDVVLTLPASFDEVARELTIRAAAEAGLPRVVLIEEPQAAFYAWLDSHRDRWESLVSPGQKILVCDIGGGTTDFTLIRVRRGEGGKVMFHRVAVGDHLILGGDNLDLALAHHLEPRLAGGGKLEPRPWASLVRACRAVKETLLGPGAPEQLTVNLPGAGARLIGGGQRTAATRDEVSQLLLEGFLPGVPLDARPERRQSGFQEFGLPYAADPAITRHLAAFLTAHRHVAEQFDESDGAPVAGADPARPDIVLFNGGFFESPPLRARLLEVLASWFRAADPQWSPLVLDNERLDLAVARGAAYYGMVRRGEGVRIAAGLARTYYVGIAREGSDGRESAVCLAPAALEPGHTVELTAREFELRVGEPVEFPFYYSSTRLTDRPGEVVACDREQLTPLPPVRTVLRTRRRSEAGALRATLHASLTEIGVLELGCAEVAGDRHWRLQFDVRSATATDIAAHDAAGERAGFLDESLWQGCRAALADVFGPAASVRPQELVRRLADATDMVRSEWPPTLLRRLWDELLRLSDGRRRGEAHEARWLNLLGYCLRPGYGLAADDWRVAETWRLLQGKLVFPAAQCRTESWILWRRIGGGLSAGQQRAIAEPLLASVRAWRKRLGGGRGEFNFDPQETVELWRLLASLERLPVEVKLELGDLAVDLLGRKKLAGVQPALVWSLGRLGARQPLYGPLDAVAPAERAAQWLTALCGGRGESDAGVSLAVMQLARRTGDRHRELPDAARMRALEWLADHRASDHLLALVREGGTLDSEEQDRVFGESLPRGLRLV